MSKLAEAVKKVCYNGLRLPRSLKMYGTDMVFGIVPESYWRLRDRIGADRKSRLLKTPFNQILSRIVAEFVLADYLPDTHDRVPDLCRALVQIHVPKPQVVDLFHNGAGGLRAQYYIGVWEGEGANRYAVERIRDALRGRRAMHPNLDCDWDFIEASLSVPGAKIWIREGAWLTDNKADNRNLIVDQWEQNASRITVWPGFEPSWRQLTPDNETRLDIKGGWIDEGFASVPSANKPRRSQEIHDFGYT